MDRNFSAAAWMVVPPDFEISEAPSAGAEDGAGLREESPPSASVGGGGPLGSAAVQAESAVLQRLLAEHRALLADFARLRGDFDDVVSCVREHGVAYPRRAHGGSEGGGSAPGICLEGVVALRKLASLIFAGAGQVGWSAALRASKSSRSCAQSVQEEKIFIAGGVSKHWAVNGVRSSELFDLRSGTWQLAPPLPVARFGVCGAVLGGYFYVCGGGSRRLEDKAARSVVCFSPVSQQWTEMPDMNNDRTLASAVAVDGGLHVLSGHWFGGVTTSIECLHPTGPTTATAWSVLPGHMQMGRKGFAAVELRGEIFICGGCMEKEIMFWDEKAATAEIFSPTTGASWSVASMGTPRALHTATVTGGKVLVAGGCTPGKGTVNSFESYCPAEDHWSTRQDLVMWRPVGDQRAVAMGGQLYLLGGVPRNIRGTSAVTRAQRLDLATGAWEELEPLLEARAGFSVGVIACAPTLAR